MNQETDNNVNRDDECGSYSDNLLSELRSVETENHLRKKLEEKIRSAANSSQNSNQHSFARQNVKSLVVKPVEVAKPVIKSAVFVSKDSDQQRKREEVDSPSTSARGMSSTVSVVRNEPRPRDFHTAYTNYSSNNGHSSKSRLYTGYDYRYERQLSPEPVKEIINRPSPPKDMPEHIRWLHERWFKYDRNFFTDSNLKNNSTNNKNINNSHSQNVPSTSSYAGDMADYKKLRSDNKNTSKKKEETSSVVSNKRKFEQVSSSPIISGPKKSFNQSSYFEWRYGGASHEQIGDMLTFKEFLISYPTDIDDQDRAITLYNEYKVDFKKRAFQTFFNTHHDEEWFMEKYHPIYKAKLQNRRSEIVQRRLEIFMNLLIRGWIETHVDYTDSRHVRKLLDATCVLLEGGTEDDIDSLSDLDYILEEKREESYDVERLLQEARDNDKEEEEEDDHKNQAEKNLLNENDSEGELFDNEEDNEKVVKKKKEETELEVMQHARDYTLYVEKHTKSFEGVPQDVSDLPDNLSAAKFETQYVGEGVFVSKMKTSRNETSLHKAAALCLRHLDPTVTRAEIEDVCCDAHGGFMRVYFTDPDPQHNWRRHCVASFWHNANLKKVLWVLRGKKLHGKPLMVFEYRDFTKRIDLVDGLAADKSVVLRDIQLCKSLIEYLDRKNGLWIDEGQNAMPTVPKINPLLNNLDECLAFHLQELIKSGKLKDADVTGILSKEKTDKRVDRDENLTRILDRLILYLRIVHSVDYYGCKFYDKEDDQPKRVGPVHLRGPASKSATPQNLAAYIKKFEENLKSLLPNEARLADEHVELLGKKTLGEETKKYIEDNIVSISEGLAKCCVCYKRFTSRQFAQSHFKEKHNDKLDEVQFIVAAYNNYLSDPNRPCDVEFL